MASKFKVGDLVWAKMKGFPPWPGKVQEPQDGVPKKKKQFIYFFGSANYAWIPEENVWHYVQNRTRFNLTSRVPKYFKEAVEKIDDALQTMPQETPPPDLPPPKELPSIDEEIQQIFGSPSSSTAIKKKRDYSREPLAGKKPLLLTSCHQQRDNMDLRATMEEQPATTTSPASSTKKTPKMYDTDEDGTYWSELDRVIEIESSSTERSASGDEDNIRIIDVESSSTGRSAAGEEDCTQLIDTISMEGNVSDEGHWSSDLDNLVTSNVATKSKKYESHTDETSSGDICVEKKIHTVVPKKSKIKCRTSSLRSDRRPNTQKKIPAQFVSFSASPNMPDRGLKPSTRKTEGRSLASGKKVSKKFLAAAQASTSVVEVCENKKARVVPEDTAVLGLDHAYSSYVNPDVVLLEAAAGEDDDDYTEGMESNEGCEGLTSTEASDCAEEDSVQSESSTRMSDKFTEEFESGSDYNNGVQEDVMGKKAQCGSTFGEQPPKDAMPISEGGKLPPKDAMPMSEGGKLPPKDAMPVSEGGKLPPKDAMPISDGGTLPPTDSMPLSEGGKLPPKDAMPVSEDGKLPPKDAMPVSEDGKLPPKDAMPISEVGKLPPTDAMPISEVGHLPPTDAMPISEVGKIPPTDAMPVSEGGKLPPKDAMPVSEGGTFSPKDAMPVSEGGKLPPKDAMPISEGDKLPPEDAMPISEGEKLPPKDTMPISEGGKSPPKDAMPVSEGGKSPPKDAMRRADGGTFSSKDAMLISAAGKLAPTDSKLASEDTILNLTCGKFTSEEVKLMSKDQKLSEEVVIYTRRKSAVKASNMISSFAASLKRKQSSSSMVASKKKSINTDIVIENERQIVAAQVKTHVTRARNSDKNPGSKMDREADSGANKSEDEKREVSVDTKQTVKLRRSRRISSCLDETKKNKPSPIMGLNPPLQSEIKEEAEDSLFKVRRTVKGKRVLPKILGTVITIGEVSGNPYDFDLHIQQLEHESDNGSMKKEGDISRDANKCQNKLIVVGEKVQKSGSKSFPGHDTIRKRSKSNAEDDTAQKRSKSFPGHDTIRKRSKSNAEDDTAQKRSKSNTEDDTIQKRSKSNAEDDTVQKRSKSKAEDDTVQKRSKSNTEDDTVQKRSKSNAKDDTVQKHSKSNAKDDTVQKSPKSNAEDDTVQKRSKSNTEDTVQKCSKSNTEDDTAQKRSKSNAEDDTAQKRSKSKAEDDTVQKRLKSNTEDDTVQKRSKSNTEDDTVQKSPKSNAEDGTVLKSPKSNFEDDNVKKRGSRSHIMDASSPIGKKQGKVSSVTGLLSKGKKSHAREDAVNTTKEKAREDRAMSVLKRKRNIKAERRQSQRYSLRSKLQKVCDEIVTEDVKRSEATAESDGKGDLFVTVVKDVKSDILGEEQNVISETTIASDGSTVPGNTSDENASYTEVVRVKERNAVVFTGEEAPIDERTLVLGKRQSGTLIGQLVTIGERNKVERIIAMSKSGASDQGSFGEEQHLDSEMIDKVKNAVDEAPEVSIEQCVSSVQTVDENHNEIEVMSPHKDSSAGIVANVVECNRKIDENENGNLSEDVTKDELDLKLSDKVEVTKEEMESNQRKLPGQADLKELDEVNSNEASVLLVKESELGDGREISDVIRNEKEAKAIFEKHGCVVTEVKIGRLSGWRELSEKCSGTSETVPKSQDDLHCAGMIKDMKIEKAAESTNTRRSTRIRNRMCGKLVKEEVKVESCVISNPRKRGRSLNMKTSLQKGIPDVDLKMCSKVSETEVKFEENKVDVTSGKKEQKKTSGGKENIVSERACKEDTGVKNVGERPETSENVGERPETSENVGERPETNENVGERPETSENVGERPETSENVRERPETSENVGKRPETIENVGERPETSENVGERPETSENVGERPETSEKVGERPETSEKVGERPETNEKVGERPETSENVGERPETSENVRERPETSENVRERPETNENVEERPDTNENVQGTTSRENDEDCNVKDQSSETHLTEKINSENESNVDVEAVGKSYQEVPEDSEECHYVDISQVVAIGKVQISYEQKEYGLHVSDVKVIVKEEVSDLSSVQHEINVVPNVSFESKDSSKPGLKEDAAETLEVDDKSIEEQPPPPLPSQVQPPPPLPSQVQPPPPLPSQVKADISHMGCQVIPTIQNDDETEDEDCPVKNLESSPLTDCCVDYLPSSGSFGDVLNVPSFTPSPQATRASAILQAIFEAEDNAERSCEPCDDGIVGEDTSSRRNRGGGGGIRPVRDVVLPRRQIIDMHEFDGFDESSGDSTQCQEECDTGQQNEVNIKQQIEKEQGIGTGNKCSPEESVFNLHRDFPLDTIAKDEVQTSNVRYHYKVDEDDQVLVSQTEQEILHQQPMQVNRTADVARDFDKPLSVSSSVSVNNQPEEDVTNVRGEDISRFQYLRSGQKDAVCDIERQEPKTPGSSARKRPASPGHATPSSSSAAKKGKMIVKVASPAAMKKKRENTDSNRHWLSILNDKAGASVAEGGATSQNVDYLEYLKEISHKTDECSPSPVHLDNFGSGASPAIADSAPPRKGNIIATPLKIGFLGLGIMGTGMVNNLLGSGHEVTVWNRTPAKCRDFVKQGALKANSPAEVVQGCDITFSCVADPSALKDLVFGNCGVLQGIGPGKAYVDMSTVDTETVTDIHEAVTARGGRFLEAPVIGSRQPAAEGQLLILSSGDKSLYEDCYTSFQAMGRKTFFLGEISCATKMKLISNLLMGTVLAGLAESLALAEKIGLDHDEVMQILDISPVSCSLIRNKGSAMINSKFNDAHGKLQSLQKDVRLAVNMSDSVDQPLHVGSAVNELFKKAKAKGYGEHDTAAVYRAAAL